MATTRTRESIAAEVRQLVADELSEHPDDVTPEASFVDDLGADSLDTVELLLAFEDDFGLEIPDEDA